MKLGFDLVSNKESFKSLLIEEREENYAFKKMTLAVEREVGRLCNSGDHVTSSVQFSRSVMSDSL